MSKADIGLAFGVAAGVFVGTCVVAGNVMGSLPPATPSLAQVFAYDPQQFERSYGAGGLAQRDAGSAMTLTMRRSPQGLDRIDGELQERCLKRLNGNAARYVEENGTVQLNTQTGARLLVCSMQVFATRICEAPYKTRLVAQLQEFVRARRAELASSSPTGLSNGAVVKTDRTPAQIVPAILAEQLRALSNASLITATDFHDDAPAELRAFLTSEAAASPCARRA